MRPRRLSLTAFGPYAETEELDFDDLGRLGLFVIAGRNGSGKTTIFDGLHYALYGGLPGRRAGMVAVRSDHADPEMECRVELDFDAAGAQWRVQRIPQQVRRKRHGDGETKRPQRATLWRLDGDQPIAIANRINEVNERCRALVGLTGPQFERVALLPQGEFSRFLRDKTAQRREVLRALFSSDVFADATSLLKQRARHDESLRVAAGEHRQARLDALVVTTQGLTSAHVATTDEIGAALTAWESTTLAARRAALADAQERVASSTDEVRSLNETIQQVEERDELARKFHAIELRQNDIDAAQRRLDGARAAVPVCDALTVAEHHDETRHDAQGAVDGATAALRANLAAAEIDFPDDLSAVHESIDAARRVTEAELQERARCESIESAIADAIDDRTKCETARDELIRTRAQLSARAENRRAEVDRLSELPTVNELDEQADLLQQRLKTRHHLTSLARELTTVSASIDEVETRLASMHAEAAEAEHARARQESCNSVARDAADALVACTTRRTQFDDYQRAIHRLSEVRPRFRSAEQLAGELFDRFVNSASVRLATTLVDGEPCSVCGSPEHPAPAEASTDAPIDQAAVDRARADAESLGLRVRELELELEAIVDQWPDIRDATVAELDNECRVAQTQAIAAENAANENRRVAGSAAEIATNRRVAQEELEHLATQRTRAAAEQSLLKAQLVGVDATAAEDRAALDEVRRQQRRSASADATLAKLRAELTEIDEQIRHVELDQLGIDQRVQKIEGRLASLQRDRQEAGHVEGTDGTPTADLAGRLDALHAAAGLARRLDRAHARLETALQHHQRAAALLGQRLDASPFDNVEAAGRAFLETEALSSLETSIEQHATHRERLRGRLDALADIPAIAPDPEPARAELRAAIAMRDELATSLIDQEHQLRHLREQLDDLRQDQEDAADEAAIFNRLQRVAALVDGDNPQNISLENWVLSAWLGEVVEQANLRLAASTGRRFELCVLDQTDNRRGRWGLDVGVVDHVTGTQRPAASLSGGELFQASLALALGMADVVMRQRAGIRIDALFIDEGFGSLDEQSVERAIDLLDDLRAQGALVGVITHVPALLQALPQGLQVVARPDGRGSRIERVDAAA